MYALVNRSCQLHQACTNSNPTSSGHTARCVHLHIMAVLPLCKGQAAALTGLGWISKLFEQQISPVTPAVERLLVAFSC